MARLLWVPSFQPGSYFPAVPIALELAGRGHQLTVLCNPASEAAFRGLGFGFQPTTRVGTFMAEAVRPEGREAKRRYFEAYETALFADVHEELARLPYDGVLVDPLEAGAGLAAEAAGVPPVSYVHWRMDETGADVPFRFHLWDGERPAADAFIDWWNGLRARVGLGPESRPASEHAWYRCSPTLTLLMGLPELAHPKGVLPPYAVRVGPLVWGPPTDRALPTWVDGLGRDRPALLGSLSTVGRADTAFVVLLAETLGGEDVDVVLTVAAQGDLPPLPPNMRLTGFVPHRELMARVAVVLCEAGNGTVTAAACAGVPLLLFPNGRDRFEVARGAVAAGIALALDREQVDAGSVREAVRTLLDTAAYRERAAATARIARRYTAAVTAADAVDQVLGLPARRTARNGFGVDSRSHADREPTPQLS